MEPDLAIYVVKMAASYMVEQIGARLRGRRDPSFLTDLTGGLTDNRTLRMNLRAGHAVRALLDRSAAGRRSCSAGRIRRGARRAVG